MMDLETMRMQRDVMRSFGKSTWALAAYQAICKAHEAMPENLSLKDRTKAIDAAYPFGRREFHPYKQWLKVRRAYLAQYGHAGKRSDDPSLPLDGGAA